MSNSEPRRLVTVSQLKTFRACPRLNLYQYVEGFRPVAEEAAPRFGQVMHHALEAWWLAPVNRLEHALAAIAAEPELDAYERIRAEIVMRGYDARWGAEPITVLAVEQEFEAAIVNPSTGKESRTFVQGGKIDAVARLADGRTVIVEHKTSSEDISPGSEYWRRLSIDAQVSTYYAGARSLGYDVEGCLYDVIGRPAHRPLAATPVESRKYTKEGRLYANQRDRDETPEEFGLRLAEAIAENPERYYARGPVVRLAEDEIEAAADTWQTTRALREAELADRWPRNPDACSRYGRTCAFFDVCTRSASLEDGTRFRKAERPHEELAARGAA